jgi:hypothetical protein
VHGPEDDVLQRSEVGEEVELLEDHPDFLTEAVDVDAGIMDGDAVHPQLAGVDGLQPVDGADQGALPAPAGAEDHHHFPFIDVQGDVPQNVQIPEPLVHLPEGDDRPGPHPRFPHMESLPANTPEHKAGRSARLLLKCPRRDSNPQRRT